VVSAKQKFGSIAAVCAFLVFLGSQIGVVDAEETDRAGMEWLERDYPYLIVDQSLSSALREFGRNLGIATEVSTEVRGRVRRYEHDGSSGEFLDYLVSAHGVDWIYDRGRLVITSSEDRVDRTWSASADAHQVTTTALKEAGIDDPRFPVGFDGGQGVLHLSAPPRYIALAAPVIERVLTPAATRTVNVIHGRARDGGI
jgi:type III secretion protein C